MVPDAILDSTAHLSWSTDMSLEILHHSHGLLTTLRVMQLHPGPELPWQDAQELLQHQQLQDLLLRVHLWSQPLIAKLLESAQGLPGPRRLLVAKLSELLAKQFLAGSGTPILLKFLAPRKAFFYFY